MIELTGKNALVTGGSRGVGRAVCLMLAQCGAAVTLTYHQDEIAANETLAMLQREGAEAWATKWSAESPQTTKNVFDSLLERNDGDLDILVLNAGIWPAEHQEIDGLDRQRWRKTLATNLDGVYELLHNIGPCLRDGGRVVLVGSTAGQRGEAGHADYAASKGALQALAKSVAVEWARRGITVNCVAPGWIDTDMAAPAYAGGGRAAIEAGIPLGRIATADDVAGPILFLCSDLARHITGEVLNVNGGAVLCG